MTLQDEYTKTADQAQDAWTSAARSWTQNFEGATRQAGGPFVAFAPVDLAGAVQQYFAFTQRLFDANLEYAKNLATAANVFTGAVRQHVEDVAEVVLEQAEEAVNTVIEHEDKLEQSAREQAQRVEQEAKEQARRQRQAEREQAERAEQEEKERARQKRQKAREARKAAQERYSGLMKPELSEELAKRNLPKTGNVDELVERLVEDDTK